MQLVRSRPPASTTLCGFRTDLLPQGRGQGSSLRRGCYGEATGAHSIPVSGVSAYHAHHGNDDDLSRRRDPRICTVYAARAAARPFGARGGLWALCTGALCTGLPTFLGEAGRGRTVTDRTPSAPSARSRRRDERQSIRETAWAKGTSQRAPKRHGPGAHHKYMTGPPRYGGTQIVATARTASVHEHRARDVL